MITRHMRTHTRYELHESTSIDEVVTNAATDDQGGGGGSVSGGGQGMDSPHTGSFGSGAGPSRSISSESENIPQQQHHHQPVLQRQQPLNKPPSPMDTENVQVGQQQQVSKDKNTMENNAAE